MVMSAAQEFQHRLAILSAEDFAEYTYMSYLPFFFKPLTIYFILSLGSPTYDTYIRPVCFVP